MLDKSKIKTEWDLSKLASGVDDPKIKLQLDEIKKLSDNFNSKWKDRLNGDTSVIDIKNAILEKEKIAHEISKMHALHFGYFASNLDQSNDEVKALNNQISSFLMDVENDRLYFGLFLEHLSKEKQTQLFEFSELAHLKHYLEKIFENGKYALSEKEEKILNLKSQNGFSNWVELVSEIISKEAATLKYEENEEIKEKVFTFNEISKLFISENKEIRDGAALAYGKIFTKHLDVATAELNSILYDKKVDDELRKMARPDTSRMISEDVDEDFVDPLLASVTARFDLPARFYKLKAKYFGLDKLGYHERMLDYTSLAKLEFGLEESIDIVYETFNDIDPEFSEYFYNYFKNGQIDVYPKMGKRGGAFCSYDSPNMDTYILLNHNGVFGDVTTIAHEMGHAINSEFMKKRFRNDVLNFGQGMCLAEVASTFFEDFVVDKISKSEKLLRTNDSKKMQLDFIMSKLDDDVSTIFRQIACYNLELDLHKSFREKKYLSSKEIGTLFRKHMSSYMGESVMYNEDTDNWWIMWHHIRYFFYVYSYASGLLISKYLQRKVREDKATWLPKFKEFLSAGTDKSPKEIFADLGIDITDKNFWLEGIKEIEQNIEKAEKLFEEIHTNK